MEREFQWLLREKYRGKPTKQFKHDAMRLGEGEPLAYIIGFTEFLGCKIDLSQKPLIPRPETEFWTEKAIEKVQTAFSGSQRRQIRALDMFAGSGCIGVSIMRHIPSATVVFAERDRSLLKQIEINCKINNIAKKRYRVLESDIFSGVRGTFDLIVANPPYIPLRKKHAVQRSVLQHEPRMALFGGADGLSHIRKFLRMAKRFLSPHGTIFMEFDPHQRKKIENLCKELHYHQVLFHRDQYGKWRTVSMNRLPEADMLYYNNT